MARKEAGGFDEDWALLVRVKCLDQLHVQTFEVGASEVVADLKRAIAGSFSVKPELQRLTLGEKVLEDHEIAGDVFGSDAFEMEGFVGLRVMGSASSCCNRCGSCASADYYGKCGHCGESGGYLLTCDQCQQEFPSSYAKEVHMKFVHGSRPSRSRMSFKPCAQETSKSEILPELLRWIIS
eukprot:Skav236716  [mRNA]  locus=scaffold2096:118319:123686:+ [translate_table: standard]